MGDLLPFALKGINKHMSTMEQILLSTFLAILPVFLEFYLQKKPSTSEKQTTTIIVNNVVNKNVYHYGRDQTRD
jgi:hypothetical protein